MKIKLDQLIVDRGIAPDIKTADAYILAGEIYVNGIKSDKCGNMYRDDVITDRREKGLPYVSRGGLKLEGALKTFGVSVLGKLCLDIGSSTGGFTDCMLQHGANHVCDVDVGQELAWKLRQDSRITLMERTNIRNCDYSTFGTKFGIITADVSFISLYHVFPVIQDVLEDDGKCICLVKPQFEAQREQVGKGGIITDTAVHLDVLKHFREGLGTLVLNDITYSPIKGTKGNIEFLALLSRRGEMISEDKLVDVVTRAHEELDK